MIHWRTRRRQVRNLETSRIQRVTPCARAGERATIQNGLDRKFEKSNEGDCEPAQPGRDHSTAEDRFKQSLSTANNSSHEQSAGTVPVTTENKRPDAELQELVDFVPQVLTVFESNGKWIHANRTACEYTGLTLDEYRSVDVVSRVIHPSDAERMRSVRTQGFTGNDSFEVEARLLGKDCGYRWFLFRYRPLIEEGRVKKWYGSATEIEARKQEEERVRREMVRLEERTRIAQELHDTLLQSFALASLQISVAVATLPSDSCARQQLTKVLHLVELGIEEGRNAILGLRAADQTPLDLSMSLSSVQQEFVVQPDTDFRVVIVGNVRPLQEQVGREVYRIGREALVNAFRHSGATWIELKLEYADSDLRMRVQDNGCGIDPGVLRVGREGHCGLTGMRERTIRIGGSLNILSRPTGTEVHLLIPGSIAFPVVVIPSTLGCELSCSC
jgi:PAS domain S-box-containing protein